jgi:beta-lactamase regulating signal transducer with metallopeptidase domain
MMTTEIGRMLSGEIGQRVGWSLLHFLWQGTAVAAALGVVLPILHRRRAQARYIAACAALAVMMILPVVTGTLVSIEKKQADLGMASGTSIAQAAAPAMVNRQVVASSSRQTVPEAVGIGTPGGVSAKAGIMWRERVEAFLPWAVVVWMVGMLGLSAWHLGGWMMLRRMRRMGRPVEGRVREIFQRLATRMHVRQAVRLLESAMVNTPVVIGWLRPAVLLPVSVMTGLSAGQIEAILSHELAHVKRWDCLMRMVQAAAETVLFFHPAVWWVSGRVRQASEECCDEMAVEICGDREGYARALAQVAGAWAATWGAGRGGEAGGDASVKS